jgi:hypothetical protein
MSCCGHYKQTVAFVLNRNTDGSEVFRERSALLREFIASLTKPGDETVTLFADGRAVEIPVFVPVFKSRLTGYPSGQSC